ncbi:MAG: glutamine--fructose-6-phosphate transaminase (isomerizing) [Deltaproteobacteria bacterium]|nr:glutamine--fructose-6-phosphate transaminase (isomerizing) [Deltaproteobacteria bacterium]
MCGIAGYVGTRKATPIIVGELRRLEYRGYDSSGVAVKNGGPATVVRCRGKLAELEKLLDGMHVPGHVGIGHTRWATHGGPSDRNAHPHKVGPISVVHNGIIENHAKLRKQLIEKGRVFASETDTEILAHLIDEALTDDPNDLMAAVRVGLRQVEGAYAVAVLSDLHGDRIIAAKNVSPLVVGLGQGENFVASDVSAILEHTRDVIYLEEGDLVDLTPEGARVSHLDGTPLSRTSRTITWDAAQAEKGGYPHFMLKEIYEQPRAIADTLRGRVRPDGYDVEDSELSRLKIDVAKLRRVVLLACGSSYHAGMVGKFLIESHARIPCEVDLASEFRYRDSVIGPEDLVIAISQSGETADTLAAVNQARASGARVLAISNVVESTIARAADATLYTQAGPEIGVASTKAFTTQLAVLSLLAIYLGRQAKRLEDAKAARLIEELIAMPAKMTEALERLGDPSDLAQRYCQAPDILFLGRGTNYPIALEGALKLKEISYIHAEGHAAGEMKHGPIALIEDGVPVVVIATDGPQYEKVLSNLAEVRAREGKIIAVATAGNTAIQTQSDAVLWVPSAPPLLQPLLTVLPLQLLAYAIAVAKGNDVDQPRNLAKSVTVE